jgi:hypothetical protein
VDRLGITEGFAKEFVGHAALRAPIGAQFNHMQSGRNINARLKFAESITRARRRTGQRAVSASFAAKCVWWEAPPTIMLRHGNSGLAER